MGLSLNQRILLQERVNQNTHRDWFVVLLLAARLHCPITAIHAQCQIMHRLHNRQNTQAGELGTRTQTSCVCRRATTIHTSSPDKKCVSSSLQWHQSCLDCPFRLMPYISPLRSQDTQKKRRATTKQRATGTRTYWSSLH